MSRTWVRWSGGAGPARMAAVAAATVVALAVGAGPAQAATPAPAGGGPTAEDTCSGWNGVASNFGSAVLGILSPAILRDVELGTPYVDGDVIRADSSMTFANWGSCGAQVAFQMQTKACGFWGCHWETRNHGTPEFLWQHADTGEVSGQASTSCRDGSNSYRVHMAVTGPVSTGGEQTHTGATGAGAGFPQGVELSDDGSADGPVVKLSC